MKLILTQAVDGLGTAGDVVEVKDGYGRNFLQPRGLAVAWTKGGEKQVTQIKRARTKRAVRDRDHALEVKAAQESAPVILSYARTDAPRWPFFVVTCGSPTTTIVLVISTPALPGCPARRWRPSAAMWAPTTISA